MPFPYVDIEVVGDLHNKLDGQDQPDNRKVDLEKVQLDTLLAFFFSLSVCLASASV